MGNKVTQRDIRQALCEIAIEMEKECGDWQSLSGIRADRVLKERVLKMAKEKLNGNV